jgi:hypothetical protein
VSVLISQKELMTAMPKHEVVAPNLGQLHRAIPALKLPVQLAKACVETVIQLSFSFCPVLLLSLFLPQVLNPRVCPNKHLA